MKYIKVNSSLQASDEVLDAMDMTTDDAVARNKNLRESGSDERWIIDRPIHLDYEDDEDGDNQP